MGDEEEDGTQPVSAQYVRASRTDTFSGLMLHLRPPLLPSPCLSQISRGRFLSPGSAMLTRALSIQFYDAVLSSDATLSVDTEMDLFFRNTSLVRNPPHKLGSCNFIQCTVHDIKSSTLRTSDSAGTLTLSASRSSAPVVIATPI